MSPNMKHLHDSTLFCPTRICETRHKRLRILLTSSSHLRLSPSKTCLSVSDQRLRHSAVSTMLWSAGARHLSISIPGTLTHDLRITALKNRLFISIRSSLLLILSKVFYFKILTCKTSWIVKLLLCAPSTSDQSPWFEGEWLQSNRLTRRIEELFHRVVWRGRLGIRDFPTDSKRLYHCFRRVITREV